MYTYSMGAVPKIKKPTELRENLFETLEQNSKGQTFLIPHKNGSSVLIDADIHSDLLEKLEVLKAINHGLQDYLDGKTFTQPEIKKFLKDKKSKWLKKK